MRRIALELHRSHGRLGGPRKKTPKAAGNAQEKAHTDRLAAIRRERLAQEAVEERERRARGHTMNTDE